MRMIGYCRVSTDKQGISLEAQEQKIRAISILKDAASVEIVIDSDASAKSLKRPGMERLLAAIDAREVDTIIIAKLDRLTRSVKDLALLLEKLAKKGVTLVSVEESLDTGSAAGRLVMNIMASVSQWEREAIGERTKAAMRHQKENGFPAGAAPYGWKIMPKLISASGRVVSQPLQQNPEEQSILASIREMRASDLSYVGIAENLNSQGLKTRSGKPWVYQYVIGVLKGNKRK